MTARKPLFVRRQIQKYLAVEPPMLFRVIARKCDVDGSTVKRECVEMYGQANADARGQEQRTAARKPKLTPNGAYAQIRPPAWYTGGSTRDSRAPEHCVVWCEQHGLTQVPPGLVIHHIDGNAHNNAPTNLWAMTRTAHTKLHHLERKLQEVA